MEKDYFEMKAQIEQERYDREMDEMITKGYFINSDGIKSTDLADK